MVMGAFASSLLLMDMRATVYEMALSSLLFSLVCYMRNFGKELRNKATHEFLFVVWLGVRMILLHMCVYYMILCYDRDRLGEYTMRSNRKYRLVNLRVQQKSLVEELAAYAY